MIELFSYDDTDSSLKPQSNTLQIMRFWTMFR